MQIRRLAWRLTLRADGQDDSLALLPLQQEVHEPSLVWQQVHNGLQLHLEVPQVAWGLRGSRVNVAAPSRAAAQFPYPGQVDPCTVNGLLLAKAEPAVCDSRMSRAWLPKQGRESLIPHNPGPTPRPPLTASSRHADMWHQLQPWSPALALQSSAGTPQDFLTHPCTVPSDHTGGCAGSLAGSLH